MREFQVMKQELQEMVHQRLDMSTELSDEAIGDVIDEVIMEKSRNMYMSSVTKLTLRQELFNAIRRLDLLQELIDDKSVSEIMVNGADSIFYERNGKIYTWDRHFESREKLEDVIQQIVSRSNRQVNEMMQDMDSIKQRDRGRFAQDIRELLDNIGDRRIYELLKGIEHQTLEILLLSTWGYSGREIAKIMGLAEQTVYTKRNRLRNKLKNLLKIE